MRKKRDKKGQIGFDTLLPYLVAVVVLLLVGWLFFEIHKGDTSLLDYIKNLWRYGK